MQRFINGTSKLPEVTDPKFDDWVSDNAMVKTWLYNSMEQSIRRSYLFLQTAQEIWSSIKETYSHSGNYSKVYEIRLKLKQIVQDGRSLAEYYSELTGLWTELDHYRVFRAECANDAQAYQRLVDEDRLIDFLGGLDSYYDAIKAELTGRVPLPDVRTAHSRILGEETRRHAMGSHVETAEKSALVITPPILAPVVENRCDHCEKTGHTRDRCWRLHPHLRESFRGGRSGRGRGRGRESGGSRQYAAHLSAPAEVQSSGTETVLSSSELTQLRNLLLEQRPSIPSTSGKDSSSHSGHTGMASALSSLQSSSSWIIDSGASDHMTYSSSLFNSYTSGHDTVRVADGSLSPIFGKGSIRCSPKLTLDSVLHAPSFTSNLLSVKRLTESLNCSVTFFPSHCVFQDIATGRTIGGGKVENGLYVLENDSEKTSTANQASTSPTLESLQSWHKRFGHPSFGVLEHLFPALTKYCNRSEFRCEPCELAKHKRSIYPISNQRSMTPFSIIHSDVWGPSRVTSCSGFRWFVTFIDCHTRITWIYLLRHKNEVFECFRVFHKMIQTQYGGIIQCLRTDNGTEYTEGIFESYLSSHGIVHQTTCVKTSEQNGVAERKNGHLLEVARSLMFTMHVPSFLWGDAVLTASYLINRLPSTVLNFKTPVSFLPSTSKHPLPLRVFGCVCFVHNNAPSRGKLDLRALKCVFVGYSLTQKV